MPQPAPSSTCSFLRGARATLFAAAAVATAGCAAEADEQAGAQFPPGQPIGMEAIPQSPPPGEAPPRVSYGPPAPGTVVLGGETGPSGDGAGGEVADDYSDTDPSALTDFRSTLDPYGQWVDDPSYGTIWEPAPTVVGADFAPYETAGHWSYGDEYVWVSDYSWGWAPFHYGRWVYATNGWGWIPGRRYAGAWATWRTGYGAYDGYVGWAPLPPTWYWRGGGAFGLGVVPPAPYAFCRSGELFSPTLNGHMITGPQVSALGASSRPVVGAGVGTTAGIRGGRTLANPTVAGPSPASLHIAGEQVTRPPAGNVGLTRAMQFAHPSTAVALGARAPVGHSASRTAALAARPASTTFGTSAYGVAGNRVYAETRTLSGGGGSAAVGRTGVVSARPTSFSHGGAYIGPSYGGGSFGGAAHGGGLGGVHGGGVAPAAQYHPPSYGGGYHPSGGGGGGGHFGGHSSGGGGHSGGHR